MRYTTIIDISTNQAVYRNINCRLVYLHLCLKSGYHDNDRDLLQMSIRSISADTGISVSATRHALQVLEKEGLLKREGELWHVKKWILEETITRRPKTRQQAKEQITSEEREQKDLQREKEASKESKRRAELFKSGKTDFMVWYEAELDKARKGDVNAQRAVERNKAVYEAHQKKMKEQNKN